jgi:hypothetical protein
MGHERGGASAESLLPDQAVELIADLFCMPPADDLAARQFSVLLRVL